MRFILFVFLIPSLAFGQTSTIIETAPIQANFEKAMSVEHPSEAQLDSIFDLTGAYGGRSGDSCMILAQRALTLSKNNQNKRFHGLALVRLADAHRIQGNEEESKNALDEARAIGKLIDDFEVIGKAENYLGILAMESGNYEEALAYYIGAAKIFESLGDQASTANTYFNISILFFNLNKASDAENYINKARVIAEELGDKKLQMRILGFSGTLSLRYGNDYVYKSMEDSLNEDLYTDSVNFYYQKAENEFQESLNIAREIQERRTIVINLNNLVALNLNMNEIENALSLAKEAENQAEDLGVIALLIQCKFNLAGLYMALDEHGKAEKYGKESLGLAQKHGLERKEQLAKKSLYRLYIKTGDYEKAHQILQEIHVYDTKVMDLEQSKALAEISAQYETIKFENEILTLKDTNRQQGMVIGGGLFMLILGFGAFQLNKTRKDRNDKIAFAEALLFAQEGERERIGRDLHDGVGQSLLLIKKQMGTSQDISTENQQLITDTLEEVRSISQDLYPIRLEKLGLTTAIHDVIEKIEKSTNLFVTKRIMNLDEIFSEKEAVHIFRAIQEALNNIVKHAEATACRITVEPMGRNILLKIMDNGKGFDHELTIIKSKSLGLRTMNERISSLDGNMKIEKNNPLGTVITFTVPQKNKKW